MKNVTTEPELLPAPNQPTYQEPSNAVATRETQAIAVSAPQEMNLAAITDKILSGDLNAEKLGLIERLVAMSAERQFAAAFNALQIELPTITASTPIKNRGKYEKYEDIMRQVGPLLNKHGFTVSFSMDCDANRILETCHLTHMGGHTRTNSFAVRAGRQADNDTQADCMAATTAKRNALCNALNIVIRQDCLTAEHDAAIEGGCITQAQADELEHRLKMVNGDVAKFLAVAGAKKFAEIRAGKYATLDSMLKKKEQGQ